MKLDALAKRIRTGDMQACSELVSEYGKMVYYNAYSELHDETRSLDVTKRTFRELFTSLRKGDVPEDLTRYLQNQVRLQSRCVDSEEAILSELLDDINAQSQLDEMFDAFPRKEGKAAPTIEEFAPIKVGEGIPATASAALTAQAVQTAQPVQPVQSAQDVQEAHGMPGMHTDMSERTEVIPNIAADQANAPIAALDSLVPKIGDPAATMPMPAVKPENLANDANMADKGSDLYMQFYGEAEQTRHKGRVGFIIGVIFAIILAVLLVWLVIGFLGKLEIIPSIDLGYSWFDSTVYPLF